MGRRFLSAAAACAASAFVVGCPHDFDAFERVPHALDAGVVDVASNGGDVSVPTAMLPVWATLGEKPMLIGADSDGVVVATAEGNVLSCPSSGCTAPVTIASGQKDIRALAMAYGFVAWTARGDNAARRGARTAGAPLVEANDDDGMVAIAITKDEIFFSVDSQNPFDGPAGIRYCTAGSDCDHLTFSNFADGKISHLLFDGADAFWLGEDQIAGCKIASCENDPNARVVLATEPVSAVALGVDAQRVYWASPAQGGSIRAIERKAVEGAAAPAQSLATNVGSPARLVVTPKWIWFTSSAAGTVSRVAHAGGVAEIVASGLSGPAGIATGGEWVYVACSGDGKILRFPRD